MSKWLQAPLLLCGLLSWLWSGASFSSETELVQDEPSPFYSFFEARHHLDLSYQSEQAQPNSQNPSMNIRWQLGRRFQNGHLDVYSVFGAGKLPATQQVIARRPEFAADIYPFVHPNFVVRQYNHFYTPFQASADPVSQEIIDVEDEESEATILDPKSVVYIPGLDLTSQISLASSPAIRFLIGQEAWSYLYSNRQYTEHDGEQIEDTQMKGNLQSMLGLRLQEGSAMFEMSGHYKSTFAPVYHPEPGSGFHYDAKRQSFYRLRFRQELTERMVLVNDFYHFHQGLFAQKVVEPQRRFRNVLRLVYIL